MENGNSISVLPQLTFLLLSQCDAESQSAWYFHLLQPCRQLELWLLEFNIYCKEWLLNNILIPSLTSWLLLNRPDYKELFSEALSLKWHSQNKPQATIQGTSHLSNVIKCMHGISITCYSFEVFFFSKSKVLPLTTWHCPGQCTFEHRDSDSNFRLLFCLLKDIFKYDLWLRMVLKTFKEWTIEVIM